MYTEDTIREIVDKQREFFYSGKTLDVEFRLRQLRRLKAAIIKNQQVLERSSRMG